MYAYKTIEEFEKYVGYKVNDTFRDGWNMARTTNRMLGIKDKWWSQWPWQYKVIVIAMACKGIADTYFYFI